MEEKTFHWLCRLLATAKVRLNLLETLFFHGEAVDSWVANDDFGCVKRRFSGEEGVSLVSDTLTYFLNKQKQGSRKIYASAAICYSVWKGSRNVIEFAQIEDMLGRRDAFSKISAMQEYKDMRGPKKWIYSYRTKYVAKVGYSSALHRVQDSFRERESNTRILHKIRDICQLVISTVEHVKLKRVVDMTLEFMQDEDGVLWLMGSETCKVAAPAICVDQSSNSRIERQSALKKNKSPGYNMRVRNQKTKTFDLDEEATKTTLSESKYIFKRGQLRNRGSYLNSPIRIYSPISSPENNSSSDSPKEESAKTFDIQASKSMIFSCFGARQVKSDRFNNSNFQEMIREHFLKRTGLTPKEADGLDFQKYMDSVLLPGAEPDQCFSRTVTALNKLKTSPKVEDVPVLDGNRSVSSISEHSEGSIPPVSPEQQIDRLPPLQIKKSGSESKLLSKGSKETLKSSTMTPTNRSLTAFLFKKENPAKQVSRKDRENRGTGKTYVPILLGKYKKTAETPRT